MTRYTGHIKGNLYIHPGDDASGVTGVDGSIWICPGARVELPVCERVGGGVYACDRVELPACKSVGDDVIALFGARVELPVCERVGGAVWRGKGARVDLPCP